MEVATANSYGKASPERRKAFQSDRIGSGGTCFVKRFRCLMTAQRFPVGRRVRRRLPVRGTSGSGPVPKRPPREKRVLLSWEEELALQRLLDQLTETLQTPVKLSNALRSCLILLRHAQGSIVDARRGRALWYGPRITIRPVLRFLNNDLQPSFKLGFPQRGNLISRSNGRLQRCRVIAITRIAQRTHETVPVIRHSLREFEQLRSEILGTGEADAEFTGMYFDLSGKIIEETIPCIR